MSASLSSTPRVVRLLPVAIFFLTVITVILLFIVPRFAPVETVTKPNPIALGQFVENTTVTGPEGKTVPLNDAIKNGWLDYQYFDGSKKGSAVLEFRNLTSDKVLVKPDRSITQFWVQPGVQPGKKGFDGEKVVEIAAGATQAVAPAPIAATAATAPRDFRTIMQVVVSIPLLIGGLFVILAKWYQPSDRHWAYATVGTISGYWLKG